MNDKKMLIVGSLALALVVGGAGALYSSMGGTIATPSMSSSEDSAQGADAPAPEAAPDFTVIDADGNEVRLSDLRGKPVVLSFWASWCGICKQGMPDFDAAYAKYGDDVHFMMVNLTAGTETRDVAAAYIEENGYDFPVYYDTEMSAASAYGVNAVPVTHLIDAQGNHVAYGQGRIGLEGIENGIEMAK